MLVHPRWKKEIVLFNNHSEGSRWLSPLEWNMTVELTHLTVFLDYDGQLSYAVHDAVIPWHCIQWFFIAYFMENEFVSATGFVHVLKIL